MAKASCMVNPLVYVCLNSDFKTAFWNLFRSLKDKYWIQTTKIDDSGLSKCTCIPLRIMHVKYGNGNIASVLSKSAEAL